MEKFQDYPFKQNIFSLIDSLGFEVPTAIQAAVIPHAIKGKDIIGISDTGSGKTHAFLLPIFQMISVNKPVVQALITAPTRELAQQIYNEAKRMQAFMPELRIQLIRGGTDKERANEQLKVQPHIVIGTPGRIRDMFLQQQTLRLETAKIFVVDEADMTLEMGFLEDIDVVAGRMGDNLQMMSFSATIPQGLKPFLKRYMHSPITVEIEGEHAFKSRVQHVLVPCKHLSYEDKLMELLPNIQPYVCMIFANTRVMAKQVAERMRADGYSLIEIHGDLPARERSRALRQIHNNEATYVVASDIASRGIDIDGVTHVISLGFPKELNFYIHRSGRTGRAGRDGICYALYADSDMKAIRSLMSKGVVFERKDLKNGHFVEMQAIGEKKDITNDETEKQIAKIVTRKKAKVKPGYKVKRKQEVEKLKRKAKRAFVQEEIKKQKIERAKDKQRKKSGYDDENW